MLGHNRKMTGAECLADMLRDYGVTHVFMVPAVLRRTFAEMERRTTIARIHTHGEKSAAYMADGYARASGRPGICMAQVIGALNLAAGLRDAWLAHSPVIAMTGGRDAKTKFRKVYQEIDDMPAFEPVTKFNATIDDVARFPDMLRQAFRVATTGTPGPVHLQFRGNEGQVDADEAELEPLVEPRFAPRAAVPSRARRGERAGRAACLQRGRAAGDRRRRRRARLGRAGGAGRARRGAANPGRDLAQRQGYDPGQSSALGRRGRQLFARERQPRRRQGRPGLLRRHRDRRHDHAFLGGAADRHAGDPDRHRCRGARPQLSAAGLRQRRRQGVARAHARRSPTARRAAGATPWVAEARAICGDWLTRYQAGAGVDAVPIRPERICHELTRHAPDDAIVVVDTGHAGMWMGGFFDLTVAAPELHPQRRPPRLGVLGRARRQVRLPGPAGGHVHRRRRLLVPHRRARDRRALEDQRRDRGQQQCQRQPVEARLRPRLWRRADGEGARAVDLQARWISPGSPRRWARWASGWKSLARSGRRSSGR